MTDVIVKQVEAWLDNVVIGLNLCPFAAKPKRQSQIHIDVYEGTEADLMKHLITALTELDHYPAKNRDTTLIVLTHCLKSFDDYNQFLEDVDWVIERGGWEGVYQVASFHPNYQFSGTHSQDPENLTNRSPYPILHLLREDSLAAAVDKYPNPEQIPETNIQRMNALTETEKHTLFPFLSQKY